MALTIHHHWGRCSYSKGSKQPAWWIRVLRGYTSHDWASAEQTTAQVASLKCQVRDAENVPWVNWCNLSLHIKNKWCKKIFVVVSQNLLPIAIASIDIESIRRLAASAITPSPWNISSANIHAATAFYISKFISGRKKNNPGTLSRSTITSLGKDTITLEVSVDDWLGMQITEKEHYRLGGLDDVSLINNSNSLHFWNTNSVVIQTAHIYQGAKTSVNPWQFLQQSQEKNTQK